MFKPTLYEETHPSSVDFSAAKVQIIFELCK